ncbi:LAETG motif-containing sortase-dependent surface protein [Streptomyces sp. NPDC048644]|uniref:LAETG motif-containing sortase-dependent surface protein n=1 Tax=Streptomyces sp. NPDC048644 TaxID=3365582 RepID=UPI0037143A5A
MKRYNFEVLPAGSKPGKVDAAGGLAKTGSSSAVPQLALAGGAAVLLGTGAVFAVRRHRGTRGTN